MKRNGKQGFSTNEKESAIMVIMSYDNKYLWNDKYDFIIIIILYISYYSNKILLLRDINMHIWLKLLWLKLL